MGMRIEIKAIDPVSIRYETCGDWRWLPDGALQVLVPNYGNNTRSELLVALHELVEAWLCREAKISEESVTAFDIANLDLEEPGDSTEAPYHEQHVVATEIEKEMALALRRDWDDHEDWVTKSAAEVSRNIDTPEPEIMKHGPRFWAELHLFALRHRGKPAQGWLDLWIDAIPFDGCPCKDHLRDFLRKNPPDWSNFFEWSVNLHNAVNARTGKLTIPVEKARELWTLRIF